MLEASDLVSPEFLSWFLEFARDTREDNEDAKVEVIFRDGHLYKYWGAPYILEGRRKRIRTKSSNSK